MAVSVNKAFEGLVISSDSALAEKRDLWSDDIPTNLARMYPFANPIGNPQWIAKFAVEWYNFYYGEIVPQRQGSLDLIAKAMSLACIQISDLELVSMWPYTGKPTWYKWDRVCTQGLCTLDQLQTYELSADYVAILKKTMPPEEILAKYKQTGDITKCKFRDQWIDWMERTKKGELEAQHTPCNTIAFMAAVSLRALAKDDQQMIGSYLRINFQENLRKVAQMTYMDLVPAPHALYLRRVKTAISKSSRTCRTLLAHCLTILLATDLEQCSGESIEPAKTFVKASCLTHLEHNGMAVCSLFTRCLRALPSTAPELASNLA